MVNLAAKKHSYLLDQKFNYFYPYASMKDVQATKEAPIPYKRTYSIFQNINSLFLILRAVLWNRNRNRNLLKSRNRNRN
jgi:hypothetical protein